MAVNSPSLVSVIMNCLDCEKYLREALDSVYAQTYTNWEIIFWDDASSDGSAKIAQSYDVRLRYFRGDQTVPLGAARNLALEQAQGEFIAFLDCDDLWEPEKLARQVPLFDDPEVGLVYSDAILFNEDRGSQLMSETMPFSSGYCFSSLLTNYFLCIPTVVIRRVTLDNEREWCDPSYEMIEEADLFIRIAYRWKLALVPEPLARWRVHAGSSTWTRGHLIADETFQMLEKYQEIFPGFSNDFTEEIKLMRHKFQIFKAMHLWRGRDSKAARHCLKNQKFKSLKAFLVFFATFFPVPMIRPFASFFINHTIFPD
jgi:glycosyltransferase involved in cell wall biosynthesis